MRFLNCFAGGNEICGVDRNLFYTLKNNLMDGETPKAMKRVSRHEHVFQQKQEFCPDMSYADTRRCRIGRLRKGCGRPICWPNAIDGVGIAGAVTSING